MTARYHVRAVMKYVNTKKLIIINVMVQKTS
jgi:hypothetical protein